jgi:hypothetical protein
LRDSLKTPLSSAGNCDMANTCLRKVNSGKNLMQFDHRTQLKPSVDSSGSYSEDEFLIRTPPPTEVTIGVYLADNSKSIQAKRGALVVQVHSSGEKTNQGLSGPWFWVASRVTPTQAAK